MTKPETHTSDDRPILRVYAQPDRPGFPWFHSFDVALTTEFSVDLRRLPSMLPVGQAVEEIADDDGRVRLTGLDRKILDVLKRGDRLFAKNIARRIGRKCDSYLKERLAHLRDRGLLDHNVDGYAIAKAAVAP